MAPQRKLKHTLISTLFGLLNFCKETLDAIQFRQDWMFGWLDAFSSEPHCKPWFRQFALRCAKEIKQLLRTPDAIVNEVC